MFSSSPVTCRFELTRSIFYNGDQVSGKFSLKATKKLPLKGIFLSIIGIEHVEWSEYNKDMPISYDDSSTHSTKDNQIFFTGNKEYIIASVQINEGIELQPGEFIERFQLNLPDQLVPTGKQPYGCVDYHLKVVIQRKASTQKKTFQKRLYLRNRIDLNKEPNLAMPHLIRCSLPNNELVFIIPQKGFVPGQHIPFSIKMTQLLYNTKIVINFCQKTKYLCQMPSSKTKEVIKVHDYYIVQNAGTGSGSLRIPFTTATSTTLDNTIMHISYHLELIVLNEKLETLHEILIPIMIGTVPLKDKKKLVSGETERLYAYDNLGITKDLAEERNNEEKIINFDLIAFETQKCFQTDKSTFSMARKKHVQRLWKQLCRKVQTSS